ncbi:DFDF domain-containing protein [Pestalotiopsis sp. NC0098]|nr:DFDF domain-containing protein [Pestalotiopsis sp. NC0098]
MDFIGLRMRVVLRQPSGFALEGVVSSIVPQRLLALENVHVYNTGEYLPRVDLDPNNILDIQQTDTPPAPATSASFAHVSAPVAVPVSAPSTPSANATFQDPAILSMGRPPQGRKDANIGEKRDPLPMNTASPSSAMGRGSVVIDPLTRDIGSLTIASTDPAALDTTEDEFGGVATPTAPVHADSTKASKRPRQRQRKSTKNARRGDDETPPSAGKPTVQGDGWRQTPILESTKSFQPYASLKKQKRRVVASAENGWMSEDVTDVQEAGEFDFTESLAKFDKKTIFEEMRQQDQIDDADRLVAHNRLPKPKPGTAGGKNLHYTENVLDTPSSLAGATKLKETPDDFWKSEADDATINGADRLSGREGSGRNSRLRGDSRLSTSRRSQSRKASASQIAGIMPGRVNSGARIVDQHPPTPTNKRHPQSLPGGAQGFYSISTDRRIETVTHLQMLNIENISHNELGFSEDLMSENAGRSISEVVIGALSDPAIQLRNAAASSPPVSPTIVILAGNNKSGARAIASGRHLRNHGVNVLVCVVGIERERDLVDEIRRQTRLFRSFGGAVFTKAQLFENLNKSAKSLTASSQASVTLIIDALLGLSISFEELRKSDQATTYELMEWANRNEAFVLAIDIPSGIDPTSGKVNIIDGAKLYVQPRYVIALGAPKQGLLKAVEHGDEQADDITVDEWKIFLADLGLSTAIWRKAATKLRRGIDFDDKWVMELRYQRSQADDELD